MTVPDYVFTLFFEKENCVQKKLNLLEKASPKESNDGTEGGRRGRLLQKKLNSTFSKNIDQNSGITGLQDTKPQVLRVRPFNIGSQNLQQNLFSKDVHVEKISTNVQQVKHHEKAR